ELGFEAPAKTPDQGANSSVLSAVDTELPSSDLSGLEAKCHELWHAAMGIWSVGCWISWFRNTKGLYMADCKLDDEQCAGFARNKEYADRLWALSEDLVKEKFDI
ncbi:hypothetical protein CSAL01_01349, partial [Colletotrichum salicis]